MEGWYKRSKVPNLAGPLPRLSAVTAQSRTLGEKGIDYAYSGLIHPSIRHKSLQSPKQPYTRFEGLVITLFLQPAVSKANTSIL